MNPVPDPLLLRKSVIVIAPHFLFTILVQSLNLNMSHNAIKLII
jgi:hypothetical protein